MTSDSGTPDEHPDAAGKTTATVTSSPQTQLLVELRVHGVSGTPAESMLDDPHPEQVAGDDAGRIFRRCEPIEVGDHPARVVEGYHWGRYTAGSPTRALWLLLLPFAMINVARFALLLPEQRRWWHRLADKVLRLLGLTLTLVVVVTSCYLAWEMVAGQCATQRCAGDSSWMNWYARRSPGIQVLIASIAPAVVVALIWSFGRAPLPFAPPGNRTKTPDDNGRVDDPAFWEGAASAPKQRAAHVTASFAAIGLLALATSGTRGNLLRELPTWADVLYWVLIGACCAGAAVAIGALVYDGRPQRITPDPRGKETVEILRFHVFTRQVMAAVAAACVVFAWRAMDATGPRPPGGNPAFTHAANGLGAAAGVLLVALLVITLVMALLPDGKVLRRGGTRPDELPVPSAFRPYWHGMGSWMLASFAVTIGFGFATAAVFWIASLLGDPVAPAAVLDPTQDRAGAARTSGASTAQIELAEGYWTAASVAGVLVVLLAVSALPMTAWLLRRRWLLALVGVAVAVTTGVVGLTRGGGDRFSTNAEWFAVAAVALAVTAGLIIFDRDRERFMAVVRQDYEPASINSTAAQSKVVRAWRTAMARYRYHHAAGLLAALGGAATCLWLVYSAPLLMGRDPYQLPESAKGAVDALATVGVGAATALAAGLVALGVGTWRNPKMRTTVGIIWDLLSFWPRVAHPLCPLPYGGRAVRAVAKRVCDLTNESVGPSDIGAAGRPFDKVVLSGHSQGGVITQAACAVLHAEAERDIAEPERQDPWLAHGLAQQAIDKTYLVTYGSQLQFIYARLFPSYFGFALQRRLFTAKLDGRWRNLYRWTDPLGGPVLSWPLRTAKDGAGARYGPTVARWETMSCSDPGSCPGHEPEQPGHAPNEKDATFRGLTYRRWTIGPDIRLRDPALVEESAFAPRLPARGHSGYPSDPGFDEVVAELIAEAYTPADTAIDVRPKVTPSAPPLIASPPSPVLIATVLAPPILAARWVRRRRRSH